MNHVLVTVSKGIIDEVKFFNEPEKAIRALSDFVGTMNIEHHDAALYDEEGLVANAKHFLDEQDEYMENMELIKEVSREKIQSLYIVGNPRHPLGFMVASPDDLLGYRSSKEALSDLGQMRKDSGNHLGLYSVVPVKGPIVSRPELETHNAECDIEDFDYSLVEEYLK